MHCTPFSIKPASLKGLVGCYKIIKSGVSLICFVTTYSNALNEEEVSSEREDGRFRGVAPNN
jgi:hypothetical protein